MPANADSKSNLHSKKVLIVDDVPDYRHLLRATIARNYDCEIFEAECGLFASVALRRREIDLVVSDFQMPNGDGFWLYHLMRENFSTVPLIIVTAAAESFSSSPDSTLAGVIKKTELGNLIPLIEKIGVRDGKCHSYSQ